MANKARYALTSATYTATGTNLQTGYPASNVALLIKPRRICRSTSTTAPVIKGDFTTTTAVGVFTIENVNFESLLIESSPNDADWTSVGTFDTSDTDTEDGRRKCLCVPSPAFNARYFRLTPSSLDSGATYYKIGAVGAWTDFTTLDKNPSVPYEKTLESAVERLEFGGGGEEVGIATPIQINLTFSVAYRGADSPTAQTQWRAIARHAFDTVMLWDENPDTPDLTKFYHLLRKSSFTITRDESGIERIGGVRFVEVA